MYSVPQKSKCVPRKAGCQSWVCGILAKFQQFRLVCGVGALLEAGEQSLGVLRAAAGRQCRALPARAPGTGSQCCSGIPQIRRAGGMCKFLPGVAFQVSSPGSWKSISTNALQGARSDRQQ